MSIESEAIPAPLGVAVVGAGYWGPNLARNFAAGPDWDLRWVCDLDEARAQKAAGHSGARTTGDLDEVLTNPEVQAVAIATPASAHSAIALKALEAGRHVLVEEPLASTYADGEAIVAAAERLGLAVMCDHTFCYTPVVEYWAWWQAAQTAPRE